jgi:hypothetical protein
MISDRILKTFTLIQEVLKLSKFVWQTSSCYWKQQFLLGDGFTKNGQFPFIDEFSLKPTNKRLYTSTYKDKKEDFIQKISRKESF